MPEQKTGQNTGLVITAHPGDFVWRAGGAIALHAKRGYRIKIVCLSFGERGESQFAWKEPGATLAKVKAGRKDEAEQAGGALGLVLAAGLDLRQRGARLLPGELAFAALAERQAHDLDPVAALGVQRDGAARAPDEVARMGGDDKSRVLSRLLFRHGRNNSLFP